MTTKKSYEQIIPALSAVGLQFTKTDALVGSGIT